jgi:endonuclease-3
MQSNEQLSQITKSLLAFGETVSNEALFPTVVQEAESLIASDPYAFAIAVCLDRGTKAEIIWTIPYDMKAELGHLDPQQIYRMSLDELAALFERLPRRPRYVNDAPKTIQDLTRIVVEECDGDATNIWSRKSAAEVNRTFVSIHGVGPGIANMGVLLIEKGFGIRFSDLDRTHMDIKPDVHTVRVLYRLGASDAKTDEAAIAATRKMHPDFPGEWEIGRRWCNAIEPDCLNCVMGRICARRIGYGAKNNKPGELTAEIGKNLSIEGYDVFYDHGVPGENVGNIVSTLEEKYRREDELSQLDIAIVEKNSDPKDRVVVLVEIEETNDRPKTILSDIFGVLFGEHVYFKRNKLQIGEFTTLIVVGISQVGHEVRNQKIQDLVNKLIGKLETQNARIGKVVIKTYRNEDDLSGELPALLKRVVMGEF